MIISINNKKAVLQPNFSIEFNEENPVFGESEAYTLSIEFPLRGCSENTLIFGHIRRTVIDTPAGVLPCRIESGSFLREGILTVTEISEKIVKCQFLSGMSIRNYYSYGSILDDLFVDELNLCPLSDYSKRDPSKCPAYFQDRATLAQLAWKDSSNHYHNRSCENGESGNFVWQWTNGNEPVTGFPYLLPLSIEICKCCGYTTDFSEWADDELYANIIACNTFENQEYLTQSLPHWSIRDYFNKLAIALGGCFSIDEFNKHVGFRLYKTVYKNHIHLHNILSEYTVENTDDCDYIGSCRIVYPSRDEEPYKYENCPELLSSYIKIENSVLEFEDIDDLYYYYENNLRVAELNNIDENFGKLLYHKPSETYFCLKFAKKKQGKKWNSSSMNFDWTWYYYFRLIPINRYASLSDYGTNEIELEVSPALISTPECIQVLNLVDGICYQKIYEGCIIVEDRTISGGLFQDNYKSIDSNPQPTFSVNVLEGNKEAERYSFKYLPVACVDPYHYMESQLPIVDILVETPWHSYSIQDVPDASYDTSMYDYYQATGYYDLGWHFNLRCTKYREELPKIDSSRKFNFKFLLDSNPPVNSIFHILGKNYLCAKMTSTITNDGMSKMKKGEFYQIVD